MTCSTLPGREFNSCSAAINKVCNERRKWRMHSYLGNNSTEILCVYFAFHTGSSNVLQGCAIWPNHGCSLYDFWSLVAYWLLSVSLIAGALPLRPWLNPGDNCATVYLITSHNAFYFILIRTGKYVDCITRNCNITEKIITITITLLIFILYVQWICYSYN